MKLLKVVRAVVLAAAVAVTSTLIAPPASAMMLPGNYDLLTNRYDRASWFWYATPCLPDKQAGCLSIGARPRLKFYDYYEGRAELVDGRYTMTVEVSDGLRCPGYNLPTHEVYNWGEFDLAGTIVSRYDVGCFNGPPGEQFWTFALQRL